MVVAVLTATLWPFDFWRPNGVSWLPETNGIRFAGAGFVVSKGNLKVVGTESDNSCTLEILLRPASIESLRTILAIYVPNDPGLLLVRQLKDGLVVLHDSRGAQNRITTEKIQLDHSFQTGKLLFLTLTSGPNGTVVYVNGIEKQVFPSFRILQSDFAGQIVMGTSPIHYSPWLGDMRGVAIYLKELTAAEVLSHNGEWTRPEGGSDSPDVGGAIARYSFNEGAGSEVHNSVVSEPDLEIPRRFSVPYKPFLQPPEKHFEANWYYLHDVLLNIAGFVPVGFIFYTYWREARNRRQAILYATLTGALLSFVIEVLQAYVPQRDSGMTDIITNTLGTALGAMLARWTMLSGKGRLPAGRN